MFSPLPLEDRLLLACARTESDARAIEDLVERGPDWQVIVRKAERLGLSPLVHTSLRQVFASGRVPKPVADHLRNLYHQDAIRSIIMREPVRSILLQFTKAAVPVIVLKGVALAAVAYPSPVLRPTGGMDLLVQTDDLERISKLLDSMKYAPSPQPAPGSWPDTRHPRQFLGPEPFPPLVIHHHILAPGRSADFPIAIEDLWKRSRGVQIESVDALVFSHEDLLLHLALQLYEADGGCAGRVRLLCDLRETCKRCGREVDWHLLVAHAEAYRAGKPLYYALRLARDLLGAAVPESALVNLRRTFDQLPFEDKFITAASRHFFLLDDEPEDAGQRLYGRINVDLILARRAGARLVIAWRLMADVCKLYLRRLAAWSRNRRQRLTNSETSEVSPGHRPWPLSSGASRKLAKDRRSPGVAQGSAIQPARGEVAVTYDQEGASDGVGAQLQRIYGIYALARALHVKYVHTPLGQVQYQGLLSLLAGRTDPEFTARYNSFFSLPSDPFDFERCERVRLHYLDQDTIEQYQERSAATGRPVLLQGLLPYRYTDRHPEAYQALHEVSPYRGYRPAGPVRVCIHLRRGDNSLSGRPDRQHRWLPNEYYLRACGPVVEALRQEGVRFTIRLHSEMPARRYTLHPETAGLYVKLSQPATIDPAQYALEDFESLPNLETVLNVEAREALDDFATADVLILSLSSLSYLGGMLNPHGLVIYAPWFHVPLPGWLVAGEHGDLNPAQVVSRIGELLRRRGRASSAIICP